MLQCPCKAQALSLRPLARRAWHAADELEARNKLEESQRQQMAEGVAAAQAAAASKVEDGYREASYAVSKAL